MEDLGRFIDPFTDFGFKRIFGSEPNKDLLIDFLNELLKGKKLIKDLTYAKNERLGKTSKDRRVVFDLYCENEAGEKFVIELQKVKQKYFKDRSLYYATFLIQEQGVKGNDWNYRLKDVYTVGIMDFSFDDSHPDQYRHEVKLMEIQRKEVFYDKLTFIYLKMEKFNMQEEDLVTHFDKWLYLLKNLHRFQEIPVVLQEQIFKKLFAIAEVSNLNEKDMTQYEASLKHKRDWQNALEYATEEAIREGMEKGMERGLEEGLEKGLEKGLKEGIRTTARNMKTKGYPSNEIAELTGLPEEEIASL